MKSLGTDTTTAGFPLVIPTQTQQPTARLTLKNDLGQVVQQWLVKQNKCTLGAAASCSLRCSLPGIAPYHALLVVGARQIFIRALAPKLSRDGRPLNEILLTDDNSHFEIAGHRFELSRTSINSSQGSKSSSPDESNPSRLKFTLARPFELSKRSSPPRADVANSPASPLATTAANAQPGTDAKWVAQLVQAAIQPIECQLHNLLEPLAELQIESRKQRRLRRKRKLSKRKQSDSSETPSLPALDATTAQQLIEHSQFETSKHIEDIVVKHSTAMDVLTERISDVNQQLTTIEQIIATEREETQQERPLDPHIDNQLDLQRTAIEQLQNGIVSVSTALQNLQAKQSEEHAESATWKAFIQDQLTVLSQVIDGLADRVAEVHESTAQITTRLDAPRPPAEVEHNLGIVPADAIANQVIAAIQGQISTLAENQPIHDSVEEVHWQHAVGDVSIEEFEVSETDYPVVNDNAPPESQKVVVNNAEVQLSVVESTDSDIDIHDDESPVRENAVRENAVVENAVIENTVVENAVVENAVIENAVVENTVVENAAKNPVEEVVPTEDPIAEIPTQAWTDADSQPSAFPANATHEDSDTTLAQEHDDSQAIPVAPPAEPSEQAAELWEIDTPPQSEQQSGKIPSSESLPSETSSDPSTSAAAPSNGFRSRPEAEEFQFVEPDSSASEFDSSESNLVSEPLEQIDAASSNALDQPIEGHGFELAALDPNIQDEPLRATPVPVEPWIEDSSQTSELDPPASDTSESSDLDLSSPLPVEEEIFETLETLQSESTLADIPVDDYSELLPDSLSLDPPEPIEATNEADEEEFLYGSESLGGPSAANNVVADNEEWPTLNEPLSATGPGDDATVEEESPIWEQLPSAEYPHSENSFADEAFSVPVQEPEESQETSGALPSWWVEDESTHTEESTAAAFDPPLAELQSELPVLEDSEQLASDGTGQPDVSNGLTDGSGETPVGSEAAGDLAETISQDRELDPTHADVTPPTQPQMVLPAKEVDDLELYLEPVDLAANGSEADVSLASEQLAAETAELQHQANEAAGDASVEDYMRKLLARMRGVPEDEIELPENPRPSATPAARAPEVAAPAAANPASPTPQGKPTEKQSLGTTQQLTAEPTEPFDPEKYMPRALAPERSQNLAAMRELANSSARTAIHKSTRQRHLSSILLKLGIATIGLTVGAVLIAINGFNLNIGLIATVASFLVAAIWGYDAATSIKPLLQAELVLRPHETVSGEKATQERATFDKAALDKDALKKSALQQAEIAKAANEAGTLSPSQPDTESAGPKLEA